MKLHLASVEVLGCRIWIEGDDSDIASCAEDFISKCMFKVEKAAEPVCPIEVPPGWELIDTKKLLDDIHHDPTKEYTTYEGHSIYKFSEGRWVKGYSRLCKNIRQSINVDMDRQPREFSAWAMDEDGNWWSFAGLPIRRAHVWQGHYTVDRKLVKSEEPTIRPVSWCDSLLVRPEFWNKHRGYTE